MSDISYRVCRVGGRRKGAERQYPYYRPCNGRLSESSAPQQLDQRRTNDWSRRRLNEDAFYRSSSPERNRSQIQRHSMRSPWTPLKSHSQSALCNGYLPNSRKNFEVFRSHISQDLIGQRSAEMAHSKGLRSQPTTSKVQEHKNDQQNLEFQQQRACSETVPLISRRWSDAVELEELAAEEQNSEFETEYNRLCPEQVNEELEEVPIQIYTSLHVRQNSLMSNPSSMGSDSTTESKRITMSATPRFTESELSTKEVQAIIARRKKQIQYGKVLDCYRRYIQVVPRHKRTKYHPQTPDIYRNYSRRGFDTLVRTWKKQLHIWEPSDNHGRSMKLGSTCESSISTDATETIETCEAFKDIKEDLDDYDSEFPPIPASDTVKTEDLSELPSTRGPVTIKAESGDDRTPVFGVVVKTEKLDYFSDQSSK